MISPEVQEAVVAARSSVRLESEWSMMNSIPDGVSRRVETEAPAEYVDFLGLADGAIFGRVVIFDTNTVGQMQFYADETEGVPVQLGRGAWFCFGKVNEDPLFIRRSDGSVWGFPDRGVIWWQSDAFEQFADSLGDFLERYALGPEYRPLSGAPEDDQWWRLLRHIRRVE
jgi:hypothetical protein